MFSINGHYCQHVWHKVDTIEEDMAKKYVTLIGNWYYFRRRRPKLLEQHPKFKDFPAILKFSLHTDSKREAERRAVIINGEIEHCMSNWQKCPAAEYADFFRSLPEPVELDETASAAEREGVLLAQKDPLCSLTKAVSAVRRELKIDGKASPKSTYGKMKAALKWWIELSNGSDDLDSISRGQVKTLLLKARELGSLKNSTINNHLTHLSKAWQHAEDCEAVLGKNPFSNHKLPNDSESYDALDYTEIEAMHRNASCPESKLAIEILATTGMRIGELCDVQVDLDSQFGPIFKVKMDKQGKTAASSRILPIHERLVPKLQGFTNDFKNRSVGRWIRDLIAECVTQKSDPLTGKPRKLSTHSFRSTVSTHLVHEGGFEQIVAADYTGHDVRGAANALGNSSYIGTASIEKKKEMLHSLPWVFD